MACFSFKDYKPGLILNPKINPMKNEIGNIRKLILDHLHSNVRYLSSVNQCQETSIIIN